MALTRTTYWATRELHQFLLSRKDMPFTWGENDCCLFAADAIQSFTGVDLADDFRGKYIDKASALAAIASVAQGKTIQDAAAYCATKHSLQELPQPLFAQRGDLVLVEEAGDLIAGIVHLNGRHVVVVGEAGLKRQSITNVKRAWRV